MFVIYYGRPSLACSRPPTQENLACLTKLSIVLVSGVAYLYLCFFWFYYMSSSQSIKMVEAESKKRLWHIWETVKCSSQKICIFYKHDLLLFDDDDDINELSTV